MKLKTVLKCLSASFAILSGTAGLAETIVVNDHVLDLQRMNSDDFVLTVDGHVVHTDGLILLDADPQMIGNTTVITGVAGSGGNACGAAPFAIRIDAGAKPVVSGPVDSCREFDMTVGVDRITYTSTATPAEPGETWIWSPDDGFLTGPDIPFSADADLTWDDLGALVNLHPADALRIPGVLDLLQGALGPDWPLFAERMSGIGSGQMVNGGYLGTVCIKITCDSDDAVIFLDPATRQVFVIYHVYGEAGDRIWPQDLGVWPDVMREIAASRGL